ELAKDKSSPKYYFMDGSPQAADVWFYPTPTADPSHVDQWRTVLLGNMRQGGRVMWALDVTDPPDASHPQGLDASLPYPGYLWEFPCEAAADLKCTGGGSHSYSEYMGETWSDPIITRIRASVGGDDNSGKGYDRWVAIFGAGYAEESDPNVSLEYDSSSDSGTSRAGRAVFVVDIKTGDLIAMKRFSHDVSQGDPRMQFSLAATPAVFDLDFDGYADVVYLGDLGGNLWKWVIKDLATLPGSGAMVADAQLDQPTWPWIRLMEADHCEFDGANPTNCPVDHYRSFFFPPTGALIHGTLWLAFGTGERNQLDFEGYSGTDQENNRFYVLKDRDPWETTGMPPASEARYNDFAGSTDFVPVDVATTCNYPDAPEIGFYIEAVDSEKFITNSSIFFGDVYTLSFIPDQESDPCTAGGDSQLYGFDLRCAEGAFTSQSTGSSEIARQIEIGGGVPNRPRVSVGPSSSGASSCSGEGCENEEDAGCRNMVVVITSDGTAYSDAPNTDCPTGVQLESWRDSR
ncbi:MAG: PilC/PilY family type IV pilus protein, partial [Myxococcota bacterium]